MDIDITTSRRSTYKGVTQIWAASHFPRIRNTHIFEIDWDNDPLAHSRTKAETLQAIRANVHVDDEMKHCIGAHRAGIVAVYFGDYPWQQDVEVPPGILRGRCWEETGEHIERLATQLVA